MPHLDAAYNLARWLTRDDHAAEDVVQEAFLRAARYFASFRGEDAKPWLLAIIRRVSFDWLAKRRSTAAATYEASLHDRPDESANPELLADRNFELARVRQALDELPPDYREIIVLRELEGLSYKEIAGVADLPIGTVMSRLSRARGQLQSRLAQSPQEEA